MPQVGDADDGRLHVLEGYATTSRRIRVICSGRGRDVR